MTSSPFDSPFDGSRPGPPLGYFTYTVADDRWDWSDGMYVLHGFEPGEIPASTAVLLSHKHPDDRARAYAVLEAAVATGQPFSCYHRIIDRQHAVRSVLSLGRCVTSADGRVETVVGFFADLTELQRVETQTEVERALARIAETREVIDQAKGMLMLIRGCDADTAFGVLVEHSKNNNLKLRDVAGQIVAAATRRPGTDDVNAVLDALRDGEPLGRRQL